MYSLAVAVCLLCLAQRMITMSVFRAGHASLATTALFLHTTNLLNELTRGQSWGMS